MSLQNSIDRLNSVKERIRVNLIAQGVTVPADAVLADMAEQILNVAGEDGRGIVSIERTSGTGAAGTIDTYTITYSDETTSTFEVRNGSDYVLTEADKTEIAEMAADKTDVSGKLDKSGGMMTGKLVAQNNADYPVLQVHNIALIQKGEPIPATSNGDIVLFYKVP